MGEREFAEVDERGHVGREDGNGVGGEVEAVKEGRVSEPWRETMSGRVKRKYRGGGQEGNYKIHKIQPNVGEIGSLVHFNKLLETAKSLLLLTNC